ncbi:MAG: hypothetical protein QM602_06875 [Microbacterium sp.]
MPAAPVPPASDLRRSRLRRDLGLLAVVGVLLVAAIAAGGAALYQQFYSPTAFVERYLALLSEGRAADALAMPGVAIDSAELEAAGLPQSSSDALLRQAALAPLTDVEAVSERTDAGVTRVEVSYTAAGHSGTTTFEVERNGWIGVAPVWRFAHSPLTVLTLTVRGSMQFSVNGFEVDKRQVSPDGVDAAALDPLSMLVFAPGAYRVAVDTTISAAAGVDVLADEPLANVPVDLQAEPTEEFISVVQERVDDFLADCATQQVLQPTGCPFGFYVSDRIDGVPTWSIAKGPTITVEPDGADWKIPGAKARAHIEVDVVSLFDGSVQHVEEDVPFVITGQITVLPDGTVSIQISTGD